MGQLAPKSLTLSECDCAERSALSPYGHAARTGNHQELEKLLNRRSTPQQIALRAKIILLADKGSENRACSDSRLLKEVGNLVVHK